MTTTKKKKPGELTPAQIKIHRKIESQAWQSKASHLPNWHPFWEPEKYPDLWKLLQAAKEDANRRTRLKGRIVFKYEGKPYAARFSNLDRIIVEDADTGEFIAQSGAFQF